MLSVRLRLPVCRFLAIRNPLYPARVRAPPVLQLIRPSIRCERDLHVQHAAAMTADRSQSPSMEASADWPCKAADLKAGRQFLQRAVSAGGRIVLAPDKDADGLSAGAIVLATLQQLGAKDVQPYFIPKGANIHQEAVLDELRAMEPAALIVLDQGSRPGPLLDAVPTLLIDHHQSAAFPDGAQVVSGYGQEPVATSATLAYICCLPLLEGDAATDVRARIAWLAIVGTFGDLGTAHKWVPPWPDLNGVTKQHSRKALGTVVSLVNAPRRTADGSPEKAWQALLSAAAPADIAQGKAPGVAHLQDCRDAVNAEIGRCARMPPKFSADGRLALIGLSSPCQVHPVIATRWSGSLKGKNLLAVMVANTGFIPDKVNFAMRIAKSGGGTQARGADEPVDLIALIKEAAASAEGGNLMAEMGQDFARGHAQATGGSVSAEAFAKLLTALGFDDNSGGKRKADGAATPDSQKKAKTLMSFGFTKKES